MSIQAALQFIQAVGQDENLKNQIRSLGHPVSGEELVQIGRMQDLTIMSRKCKRLTSMIGTCDRFAMA